MAENICLVPGPIDPSVLYDQKNHISEKIWMTPLSDKIKEIHNYHRNFPTVTDPRVLYMLNVAGFYGLYSLGSRKVDNHLITALIERWRPETNTFHFPSDELTMTLQDIEVLAGVKVNGEPLIYDETGFTKNQRIYMINDLLGPVTPGAISRDGLISFNWLKGICTSLNDLSSMDEVVRVTRACMLLIIGSIYLQDNQGTGIAAHYLLYMQDLNKCGQYSWGAAILAYLYRSLYKAIVVTGKEVSGLTGAVQLLQYWAWSRFTFMRPYYLEHLPNDDIPVEGFPPYPYGRRFAKCRLTYQMGSPSHGVRVFRDQFDQMSPMQIIWEPYPGVASLPECSKAGRSIWLARVPLICTSVVEFHPVDRVMRQFSFRQVISAAAIRPAEVRAISRKGRPTQNWVQRFAQHIATWEARNDHIQNGEFHFDNQTTSGDYRRWYARITRRWICKPVSQPPVDGPHPSGARMGLMVEDLIRKYEKAVERGNESKKAKCLNMFAELGIRPPEVEHVEIPHRQPSDDPPHRPSDCYIPEPLQQWDQPDMPSQWGQWNQPSQQWDQPDMPSQWGQLNQPAMTSSSFPPNHDSQWGQWNQPAMPSSSFAPDHYSQWGQWNQPDMPSSSFADDTTRDFFNEPNIDFSNWSQ